jgi:hypothetical protein
VEEFHGQLKIGGGKKRVLLDWRENGKEEEEDGAPQTQTIILTWKNIDLVWVTLETVTSDVNSLLPIEV